MKYSQITTALLLASSSLAAPLNTTCAIEARADTAASIISKIAPTAAACTASDTDCRTPEEAAPYLINALSKYGVINVAEIAGVLALMAYESDDFKYKTNSKGTPGQGTANMQMFAYNLQYAQSIPELADKVSALGTITTDDQKNQLLALVTDDNYNFGSGPWFYTTQCDSSVQTELQQGTDAGFAAYMSCVGVDVTDARTAYWTAAKLAFGL